MSAPTASAGRGGLAADFLLEIGCEEIPARMIEPALADLDGRLRQIVDSAGLSHGESRIFSTPRRLAVILSDVSLRQEERQEQLTGPPAKTAYGPDGKPAKAAVAFAQKAGVSVDALRTIQTPKGDYLAANRLVGGRPACEILAEELPRAIAAMRFPKMMRWGDGSRRFVRPVHWVVALLGADVVPFELLGVRSGRGTSGHRTLGARGPAGGRVVEISSPTEYESTLLAHGVVADRMERRGLLARKLIELAGPANVRPVDNPELLEEVADLVEHPGAVLGSFPREFLQLPREVLVTTLRHHQKSFSTETDDGLSNHFLSVADVDCDPEGHVRKGNEWVVVGRLDDARFFYDEDRKVPIALRREKLRQVTFHAKAGSYFEKSERIERISVALAQRAGARGTGRSVRPDVLREAARLCKCDLTTGLVGEFPELQGIAGGLYIKDEIESARGTHGEGTAQAVYDQYRPAGGKDSLPRTVEASFLALADRLDTLMTLSRVAGLPTGSKDPFALRRAAYCAIRIVIETPLALSLREMVDVPCEIVARSVPEEMAAAAPSELYAFVLDRLNFWLKERGHSYDTIRALIGPHGERGFEDTLPRLVQKGSAIDRLREQPDLAALIEIQKRCRNIAAQAAAMADPTATLDTPYRVDPEETRAEAVLTSEVERATSFVAAAIPEDRFEDALAELVRIRPALSDFFDHVLVMHPEPAVRLLRLDLVGRVQNLILNVADFTQIAISREEMREKLGELASQRPR